MRTDPRATTDAIDRAAWLAERSVTGRIASIVVARFGAAIATSRTAAWQRQAVARVRRTPFAMRATEMAAAIGVAIGAHLVIARWIPIQDRTPPVLSAAILLCAILAAIAASARSR